jgi:NADPH-dependent F420 reductase
MQDTIAIVGGTGAQGHALSLRFAQAGATIRIGSRKRERAIEVSEQISEASGSTHVQGFENAEAVQGAGVAVLTVPPDAQIETLDALGAHWMPGTVLVDATVRLKSNLNSALIAAEHVPDAVKVASAFHTLGAELLTHLDQPIDGDVLVCADDPDAKAVALRLAGMLKGARPLDAGGLKNSRQIENAVELLIALNRRHKVKHAGLRITGL